MVAGLSGEGQLTWHLSNTMQYLQGRVKAEPGAGKAFVLAELFGGGVELDGVEEMTGDLGVPGLESRIVIDLEVGAGGFFLEGVKEIGASSIFGAGPIEVEAAAGYSCNV